jgi:hypothetical protein
MRGFARGGRYTFKGGTVVVIYGIKELLNPIKAQLSDAIQTSMTEVLGLPESKRAHRIVPLDKSDFYYPKLVWHKSAFSEVYKRQFPDGSSFV